MGLLQNAGPAGKERRACEPIAACMHCAEGIIKREAPVCQVREVRERVLRLDSVTMASVPAKDGEMGDESIQGQQGSQGKERYGRDDPRSLETERWIEGGGFTCSCGALPERHFGDGTNDTGPVCWYALSSTSL